MAQGNHDRSDVAYFRNDHFACIVQAVGVTDVKFLVATIEIANCCNVFRARGAIEAWTTCFGWFALHLHGCIPEFFCVGHPSQPLSQNKYRQSYNLMLAEKSGPWKPRISLLDTNGMFCKEM